MGKDKDNGKKNGKKREGEKKRKKEEEARRKEEEEKKAAAATPKWGAAKTNTKSATPEPSKPKWGSSAASKTAAAVDEVPKKKPWEKPSAAAKSSLPSLNESSAASKSKVTFNDKSRKTSE